MSALPMNKTCLSCGKTFSYNPSVGKFGLTCPYCSLSKSVGSTIGITVGKAIGNLMNSRKGV